MSSGFTLLRAIQKFVSTSPRIQDGQTEGYHLAVPPAHNVESLRVSKAVMPGGDGHEQLILPPPEEIMPLVDIYFRYFRKYQLHFESESC